MASTLSKTMLTSLTTAALAIPGIAQAEPNQNGSQLQQKYLHNLNGGVPQTPVAAAESTAPWYSGIKNDIKYTRYAEDGRRMDIDTWQALLLVPLNDFEFQLEVQKDSMSGASVAAVIPQFYEELLTPDPTRLIDGRTNATIQDELSTISFSTNYKATDAIYGVNLYYASENDTVVPGISVSGQWNFNKNNTLLQAGAGIAQETIKPVQSGTVLQSTPAGLLGRKNGSKTNQKFYLSLLQYLSKYNYVQLSTEFQYYNLKRDDQYRPVTFNGNPAPVSSPSQFVYFPSGATPNPGIFVDGVGAARQRKPGSRAVFLPMLRFVQFIPWTEGSAHLDYRYAADSWSMNSHMVEFTYYQPILSGWTLAPKIRYYTQTAAKFYGPTFNAPGAGPSPFPTRTLKGKHYTSDYRLSSYGTLNYEIKVSYETDSIFGFGLTAGYYKRKAGYGAGSKDPIAFPEMRKGVGAKYFSAELNLKL